MFLEFLHTEREREGVRDRQGGRTNAFPRILNLYIVSKNMILNKDLSKKPFCDYTLT